jgi:hypothetical protein
MCFNIFPNVSKWFRMFQYLSTFPSISQYFLAFLNIFRRASICFDIFSWILLCLTMFDYVWLCLTMFDYVSLYFNIFQHVLIYFCLFPCTSTSFNKFKILHRFRVWWNMLNKVLWYSNIGLDLTFLRLLFQYIQQTCIWLSIDYYGLNLSTSDIKKLLHWKNDDLIVLRLVISRAW